MDEIQKYRPFITSRGIPGKEAMWLPPHDSPELMDFQDSSENPTRNSWTLGEVVNFVFPKKFQRKYNEIGLALVELLLKKGALEGDDAAELVKSSGISKATLYIKVIPHLKRVGMLKVEKMTPAAPGGQKKYMRMKIYPSKTFGNYLMKIGDSWLAAMDDARSKRKQDERLNEAAREAKGDSNASPQG